MSFAELVAWQSPAVPTDGLVVHGTTVLAIRFDEGVLLLADRRATAGNLIMYEQAEKLIALDRHTAIAISGAYARSIEICRYLKHSFKYHARMHLQELSTQGKLMEISRALAGNLPDAMQGVGVFLPIVATFEPKNGEFGIHFFDAAGARFQSGEYAAAGSGSERIRGVFEYLSRRERRWHDRSREESLLEAMRMLDIASDLDSATGGLTKVMPLGMELTSAGASPLSEDELRGVARTVLA